jgi:hypothetical protein
MGRWLISGYSIQTKFSPNWRKAKNCKSEQTINSEREIKMFLMLGILTPVKEIDSTTPKSNKSP